MREYKTKTAEKFNKLLNHSNGHFACWTNFQSRQDPDWKVCKMRKGDTSFTQNMRIKILKIAQIQYVILQSRHSIGNEQ